MFDPKMVWQSFLASPGLLLEALGGALGSSEKPLNRPKRAPDSSWNSLRPGLLASCCRRWAWEDDGAVDVVFYLLSEPLGVDFELLY